ncbi:MAG: Asp/Glu racemase [Pseudomonadota bacterium]
MNTNWQALSYDFKKKASQYSIGLIVLSEDMCSEPEMNRFLYQSGANLYASRIAMNKIATKETLKNLKNNFSKAVELFPSDIKLDVISFSCTTGSIVTELDELKSIITKIKPDIPVTNPMTASIKGLRAMNCKKPALITPYLNELNEILANYLIQNGFEISKCGSFNLPGDPEMNRVDPESVYKAAIKLNCDKVDSIFISCTGLWVSSIIERIENKINKPVISSNQAQAWDCLRLSGNEVKISHFGKLLLN